jgi:hypothetical protein
MRKKPLASSDIAEAIVTEKGFGRPSIHALTRRVRANLSYLLRNKRVVKTGDRLTARWAHTFLQASGNKMHLMPARRIGELTIEQMLR